jgi:hypothetical protein
MGRLLGHLGKLQNLVLFWTWLPIGKHCTHTTCICSLYPESCTTSCLLCYLSSAYPQYAIFFQLLIALDFSSHYMHMYRYCVFPYLPNEDEHSFSSLVTGSTSHKLVTSDVSRILWMYYNDSVRVVPLCVRFLIFGAENLILCLRWQ